MMDVDKGRDLFVHLKKWFSLVFEGGRSFPGRALRTSSDDWNPDVGFIQESGLNSDFSHPGLGFGEPTVFVLGCSWNICLFVPISCYCPLPTLSQSI